MAMYILSLINFLINGKFEVQSFDPNYEDQNELIIDEHEDISPKKLPIDVKNWNVLSQKIWKLEKLFKFPCCELYRLFNKANRNTFISVS